jgi:hypothetical protein
MAGGREGRTNTDAETEAIGDEYVRVSVVPTGVEWIWNGERGEQTQDGLYHSGKGRRKEEWVFG